MVTIFYVQGKFLRFSGSHGTQLMTHIFYDLKGAGGTLAYNLEGIQYE